MAGKKETKEQVKQAEEKVEEMVKSGVNDEMQEYYDAMDEEQRQEQNAAFFREPQSFRFTKLLIDPKTVPLKIRALFWAFLNKRLVLSNLEERDINKIMLQYDDSVVAHLMSKPVGDYSFQEEFDLTQLRSQVFTEAKRSKGGFERVQLNTQIRGVIGSVSSGEPSFTASPQAPVKKGIGGKISRFFGK